MFLNSELEAGDRYCNTNIHALKLTLDVQANLYFSSFQSMENSPFEFSLNSTKLATLAIKACKINLHPVSIEPGTSYDPL